MSKFDKQCEAFLFEFNELIEFSIFLKHINFECDLKSFVHNNFIKSVHQESLIKSFLKNLNFNINKSQSI